MERGMRFFYIGNYLSKNQGVGITEAYGTNPYETEAYFYGWAYDNGYVDIYGRDIPGKGGVNAARKDYMQTYGVNDPVMENYW